MKVESGDSVLKVIGAERLLARLSNSRIETGASICDARKDDKPVHGMRLV